MSAELGVPEGSYHDESFDAAVKEDAPAPALGAVAEQSFSVRFTKKAKSIDVRSDQAVLSCAKKAGVRIASSCANGICGTCKSKLVSGSVDMKHDGGIRQREIDAGFFLPCCSRPLIYPSRIAFCIQSRCLRRWMRFPGRIYRIESESSGAVRMAG